MDQDSPDEIDSKIQELFEEMVKANDLSPDDIVSVIITATSDIHSKFPAGSLRKLGLDDVALLGAQEIDVIGAPGLTLRILVHFESDLERSKIKHIYLHGAKALRADIAAKS